VWEKEPAEADVRSLTFPRQPSHHQLGTLQKVFIGEWISFFEKELSYISYRKAGKIMGDLNDWIMLAVLEKGPAIAVAFLVLFTT